MSKHAKGRLSPGAGYVCSDNMFSFLQGRIFTLIEALGLKESQEKSLKDLIGNEIHYPASQRNNWSYWIPEDFHDKIIEARKEMVEDMDNRREKDRKVWSDYEVEISFKLKD